MIFSSYAFKKKGKLLYMLYRSYASLNDCIVYTIINIKNILPFMYYILLLIFTFGRYILDDKINIKLANIWFVIFNIYKYS